MKKHYGNTVMQIAVAMLVFILQLISAHFNWQAIYQIEQLEFGMKAFTAAACSIVAGMASGAGAAFLLRREQEGNPKKMLPGAVLFGIISCLGILFKILFSAFGFLPFSVLRPVFSDVFEWTIHSQIPSFWLGFMIRWLGKNIR